MAAVVYETQMAWGQVAGTRSTPSFPVEAGDLIVVLEVKNPPSDSASGRAISMESFSR